MQHLPDSSEGALPLVRLGRCHTSLNSRRQSPLGSELMVTVSKLTFGSATGTDISVRNARDSCRQTREPALAITTHSFAVVKD